MSGRAVLDAQLRALRAQLVATVAFLNLLLDAPAPDETAPEVCPHPETETIGTMGYPARRRCLRCHEIIEAAAGAQA